MKVRQTEEYQKWFNKLKDYNVIAAIARRVEFIEHFSHFGDYKVVGENVLELRIHCGSGIRIYCTMKEKEVVLLLCGGDKSSQKSDIEKAKKLAKEV